MSALRYSFQVENYTFISGYISLIVRHSVTKICTSRVNGFFIFSAINTQLIQSINHKEFVWYTLIDFCLYYGIYYRLMANIKFRSFATFCKRLSSSKRFLTRTSFTGSIRYVMKNIVSTTGVRHENNTTPTTVCDARCLATEQNAISDVFFTTGFPRRNNLTRQKATGRARDATG